MGNTKDKADHQTLGEALHQFVEKNHLQKGLDKIDVEEAWNREMGAAVRKYTTNVMLKRNTLYVQLSSSVLREELSYGKEKIIKILNEALGKELLKKIVLR